MDIVEEALVVWCVLGDLAEQADILQHMQHCPALHITGVRFASTGCEETQQYVLHAPLICTCHERCASNARPQMQHFPAAARLAHVSAIQNPTHQPLFLHISLSENVFLHS
jgi:hypothetical protein